jgi:ribA/ribD-fused uncharacterized protein
MDTKEQQNLYSITSFKDEWEFLSNFYPAPITYDGAEYPTVEHAFQAAKTLNPAQREEIRVAPTPGKAKQLGRIVDRRPDWELIKQTVMAQLLAAKFTNYPELRKKLIATGNLFLEEGNTWHDNYWGACTCDYCKTQYKYNILGTLLMTTRVFLQLDLA